MSSDTGKLAAGLAGSAIGFAGGGLVGAAVGGKIGESLGGALFGSSNPRSRSPGAPPTLAQGITEQERVSRAELSRRRRIRAARTSNGKAAVGGGRASTIVTNPALRASFGTPGANVGKQLLGI